MNNYDKLSPLAIINNPNLIRVPVTMNPNNGDIVVFVGDAHIRIYNDQTLPDHLKASLVQIRTIQNSRPFISSGFQTGAWVNNKTNISALDTIGWRVQENFFVVVMNFDDFDSMRGKNDFARHKEAVQFIGYPDSEILSYIGRLERLKQAEKSLRNQFDSWSFTALEEEYKRLAMSDLYQKLVINQILLNKLSENVEELMEKHGDTREQSKSEGERPSERA